MKIDQINVLKIISRASFGLFISVLVSALFIPPKYELLTLLFCAAVIFEILYQSLSGVKEAKAIKLKKENYSKLPAGFYRITDKNSGECFGELSAENVDFLRMKFIEQGMEDNDFYFMRETLELFIEEEKPNKELVGFLENALKGKDEIELNWKKD
ncbi:MAG: hypothetical protein JW914_05895 [Syntrophaceae bacterium]|nr:hypothetical protein [Syntrophaceae bacterium]